MYFGGIAFLRVELLRGFSRVQKILNLVRLWHDVWIRSSRASAVLQSNLIAIKFGTAEARRLNWAQVFIRLITITLSQKKKKNEKKPNGN